MTESDVAMGSNPVEEVKELAVDRIVPNPLQPRRYFDAEQIRALANSIDSQGIIQPVIVRHHPEKAEHYELVAGERRLRAIQFLGWPAIPALVRQIADRDLLEAALVENLQREQLTPIEEAQAYRDLMDRFGYTQEGLAQRVGKERSTIANMVRLLGLPFPIQQDVEKGRLTVGHARALLPISDPAHQVELRDRVLRLGLSVRETERLVRKTLHLQERDDTRHPPGRSPIDPQYQAVQEALEARFGTRVTIRQQNHRGRLELEFYSLDDFNRIYDLLFGRKS